MRALPAYNIFSQKVQWEIRRNCKMRRNWGVAVQGFIITHPARTSIKVLIELFQKFAESRGSALVAIRRSRNSPAFCFGKKRAWEKPTFLKGAAFPIQNSIREADSSFL